MIAPEYTEQYSAHLPEEIKLNGILEEYQEWQESVKKVFQVIIINFIIFVYLLS